MSDCIFCKIVARGADSHRLRNRYGVGDHGRGHVNPGHTLVIVKPHVETIMELDEDLAADAFRVANRVAKALEARFSLEGMTILQANRPAGWRTVNYFHFHVLPRAADDGVTLTWPAKNPPREELAARAEEISSFIVDQRTEAQRTEAHPTQVGVDSATV